MLNVSGNVGPQLHNIFNLGSSALRWANMYATNVFLDQINGSGIDSLLGGGGGIAGTIASPQIAYGTSADTIGGTSTFVLNSTSVYMGVGTASPAARIHMDTVSNNTAMIIETDAGFSGVIQYNKPGLEYAREGIDESGHMVFQHHESGNHFKFRSYADVTGVGWSDFDVMIINQSGFTAGSETLNNCVVLPNRFDSPKGADAELVIGKRGGGLILHDGNGVAYRIYMDTGGTLEVQVM
jgi:hypothetical protein